MKAVWKFTLSDNATLDMPVGAKILSVQGQGDDICMWAFVDTEARVEKRQFVVYGTGHQIPFHNINYIGTAQIHGGRLVFHVFEVVRTGREGLTRADAAARIPHG